MNVDTGNVNAHQYTNFSGDSYLRGSYLSSMAGQLSSQPFIYRLPTEILIEILLLVKDELGDKRWHRWSRLLRVCKKWYDVLREAPILWRTIYLSKKVDREALMYSLTYSRDALINIDSFHCADMALVTSLLSPHLHRVRVLKLDDLMRINSYPTASLLYHDMPMLETLKLSFEAEVIDGDDELSRLDPEVEDDEEGSPTRYPFFWFPKASQFPRIVSLELGRLVALQITRFPVFTTLKKLVLDHCTVVGETSLQDFFAHLAAHPLLEEVYLNRTQFLLPNPSTKLHLPSTIRKFCVEDFPTYISHFFSSLSPIPPTVNVRLRRCCRYIGPDDGPEEPTSSTYSLPPDRSVLPILDMVDSVTITVDHWEYYTMVGRTPAPDLTLAAISAWAFEDHQMNLLEEVCDAFGRAQLTELRVDGHGIHEMDAERWMTLFRTFPGLRRIAITATAMDFVGEESDCVDARPGLLKALSIPAVAGERAADPGAAEPVPCPGLETLVVCTMDPHEDRVLAVQLAECLESRVARGLRVEELKIMLRNWERRTPELDSEIARRKEVFTDVLAPNLVGALTFVGEEAENSFEVCRMVRSDCLSHC